MLCVIYSLHLSQMLHILIKTFSYISSRQLKNSIVNRGPDAWCCIYQRQP